MQKVKRKWEEFLPKSLLLFKQGYSFKLFGKDCIAGTTVGIVALPLAMAFAMASGVSPDRGLYTAIIAGFLISLLGGSSVQIGGPTGAFIIIVYDVVQRVGYEGLIIATLLAGCLLIIMGVFRLGTLIKFIPYPLTTGLTAGIAFVIFSSQIKDFFGLTMAQPSADVIEKWTTYIQTFSTWDPTTLCVASGTLLLIILMRRYFPIVPWGVVAIIVSTLVCWGFDLPVQTVRSAFGEIPRTLPLPHFPQFTLSFEQFRALIPDAIAIALLAGLESLLSAVVGDGMSGGRHKSNCELIAQGVANIGSMLFGGIPATGAIARTATNVKTGAVTPVAGMLHAVVLFLIILFFAPAVSLIPLPALSALLMMVAWSMSEIEHCRHLLRAPPADIAIMLTAFFLTIFVDLTVAVEVGVLLAALLFMKRMSDVSSAVATAHVLQEDAQEDVGALHEREDAEAIAKKTIPAGVEVYEISGPFFFGIADRLKDILHELERPPRVFILRMRRVELIDATALHALKDFYLKCQRDDTSLVLSGVQRGALQTIKKYGLQELIGVKNITPHIDEALKRARELLKS